METQKNQLKLEQQQKEAKANSEKKMQYAALVRELFGPKVEKKQQVLIHFESIDMLRHPMFSQRPITSLSPPSDMLRS